MSKYIQYIVIWLISYCVLLGNPEVYAATVVAGSASNADIQTAITSASSGDTVTVPAETVTWTGAITIPVGKTIYLVGVGSTTEGTVIKYGAGAYLNCNSSDSTISGFRCCNSGKKHRMENLRQLFWSRYTWIRNTWRYSSNRGNRRK